MRKSLKCAGKKKTPWVEGSGNIYKDLGFGDEEAANLFARAHLLLQLQHFIEDFFVLKKRLLKHSK